MKIRPVGVELFHADDRTDGRTDVTKLIVAFCNFVNAPKKKRLREPHGLYGSFGEEKLLFLPGIEPRCLRRPTRSQVTTPSTLSRVPNNLINNLIEIQLVVSQTMHTDAHIYTP